MALPFEARPPVKGMEKPILIGSAARTAFGPSRAGSARAAAANACRNIVLQYIGFAPLTLLFGSVAEAGLARRNARDRRPVLVGIAVGDGIEKRVTQDAGEGQRHVGLLARLEREVHVLHAENKVK